MLNSTTSGPGRKLLFFYFILSIERGCRSPASNFIALSNIAFITAFKLHATLSRTLIFAESECFNWDIGIRCCPYRSNSACAACHVPAHANEDIWVSEFSNMFAAAWWKVSKCKDIPSIHASPVYFSSFTQSFRTFLFSSKRKCEKSHSRFPSRTIFCVET